MTVRNNQLMRAAWLLVVACLAAAMSAADKQEGGGGAIANICQATGFSEECGKGNITEAKQVIKEVFDAAVDELHIAIKNTTLYKKIEKDIRQRRALDVCEDVLGRAIDDLHKSFEKILEFEIGQMDHSLDTIRIWISSALTYKEICSDAFAKTRGGSGPVVRQMLKKTEMLLSKSLHVVIEFQKNFQSIKKDLGALVDSIKAPKHEGHGEIPDFVQGHARKLIENPRMSLPPNVVVAKDGSGQFKTITEAVNTVPLKNKTPFVILVKKGVYEEFVVIPKKVNNVVMIGEGPLETRITSSRSFKDGFGPFNGATFKVEGEMFLAKDIGFENTAGPIGHQATALRATGDCGIYYNVHFDSFQDTLYPSGNRQFFRDCRVTGTVDFIFGDGVTVLQNCELVVRKPDPNQKNMVTAQGRYQHDGEGIIIVHGCKITAEQALLDADPPHLSFLGRPWKPFARTFFLQSTIEGFIDPTGWFPWEGSIGLDTLKYGEYGNKGAGADLSKRVDWPGIVKINNDEEARAWLPLNHFKEDAWILESGVPYTPGFL